METRGLVTRITDSDDRRGTKVRCTEKGEAFRHLSDFHETINAAALDGFAADEVGLFFDMLDRVTRNAAKADATS
jgi:DNA-binding MarR family transcriptional regulator